MPMNLVNVKRHAASGYRTILPVADLASYQNRLAKNARHLRKWAARNAVNAYRLYDCDMPEFPLIVDFYATDSGPRLHVQEVDTGWRQSPEQHQEWIDSVVSTSAETLAIDAHCVTTKTRARQRPRTGNESEKGEQYRPTGRRGEELVVREGGHRFLVNLQAYLDTGLFLDHRNTRRMIGERAAGKRFLNLFAYTGSFTIYAARGTHGVGASSSATVDLSNTYCDWAERNLRLNGIDPCAHRVVRADVLAWLENRVDEAAADEKRRFDLIVLDPPTFSNSKKMPGVLDVQRDHPRLIRQCLALLAREGELFFSTNLRSFRLDPKLQTVASLSEISARTVPEDFRDKKIHRCWQIKGNDCRR